MFEDAAQALEEIEPEDKTRNEVLYARVDIYLAAKKWHMAAAVARHLVKADPRNPTAWINLAYAVRPTESIEQAEAILLKARTLYPKSALIAQAFRDLERRNYASFDALTGLPGHLRSLPIFSTGLVEMGSEAVPFSQNSLDCCRRMLLRMRLWRRPLIHFVQ
jgi:hypothetical protein